MKRVVLGTAGHVDHGKTTLVKALTGVDTDRLKEEKERGITIELGFARLDLPSGVRVGIVDVPGHERFVRTMVAGAAGVDLVALVVAADEGVRPQTREHLEICELLGVKAGLVVLTKKDLVDEEWLELVREEVREALKGTFLEAAPMVAVSAVTGEGLDRLVEILDELVRKVPDRSLEGPFRLPVDRVFTVKGFGTVVTGTALSGRLEVGQEVEVYPKGVLARVRRIQSHGEEREEALAGMRTALNLQGVEKEEVSRGDVVAEPGVLRPSQILDLELLYLKSAPRPLRNLEKVHFHLGTAEIMGEMVLFGKDRLEPGERDVVQVRLSEPVVCLRGDRFVIRSGSPLVTVGGGRVLNPLARRRKRTKPWEREELERLRRGGDREVLLYHLEKAREAGLRESLLRFKVSVFGDSWDRLLAELGDEVVRVPGEEESVLISRRAFEEFKEEILRALAGFHERFPLKPGLTKEELRARVSDRASSRIFEAALSELLAAGRISAEREFLRLSTHRPVLPEEAEALKREIEEIFRKAGFTPPDPEEALSRFRDRPRLALDLFEVLVQDGVLVRLSEKLYFHREALERARKLAVDYLRKHGEMGVGDFRRLTGGASRKYLIPLLEYLDREKVTIRVGDKRILRKGGRLKG
ncbi:selenocysteine-specific translation elongation factor [Thermosulfurimonas sp. F29]|uniref:selenocysteine-specific translation elongation factor n=1 Tax=Thermosulfurimonas sp. F29 TaxID=2867247 RepID=UPI001C8377AF|nr:selenocysteine-specific translation elongation factor [Thermosulfurimonas sp. F29]MBX6422184.1 selenocysteine-specific translation elongation factor [Thermosulfurimonas sp. F29]